jgi:DNA-directed RNA polymerase subunit beta'
LKFIVQFGFDINEIINFITNLIKKIKLNDNTVIEYYENLQIRKTKDGEIIVQYIKTTTGRVILNYTIQKTLNFL